MDEAPLRDPETLDTLRSELARLRARAGELERMLELQAMLVSVVAHDLRNPLTSMIGYLELLQREQLAALPDLLRLPVASIRRNSGWLRILVERLNALSSVGQPRAPAPADLALLASRVCDDGQAVAEHYHCRLERDLAGVGSALVDAGQISFALLLLLIHQIKRTAGGSATLRLAIDDDLALIELHSTHLEALDGALPGVDGAQGVDVEGTRWKLCAELVRLNGGALDLVDGAQRPRIRMTLPRPRS